ELDIIAGKDLPSESQFFIDEKFSDKTWNIGYYQIQDTRLYGLDIVPPSVEFSVHDYDKFVRTLLPTVSEQTLPVFVGGSNFYISALLTSIETATIPPNPTLRKELTGNTVAQLRNILHDIDRERLLSMNDSDGNNPRRLTRAIEVAKWKKNNTIQVKEAVLDGYEVLHIGLTAPLEYLRTKIDARVDTRIAQGAVAEAEELFKQFDSLSGNVKTANGYKQLFEYLDNKISYEDAIQQWKFSEYHNAKKQLTWIHGDSKIKKYSILDDHFPDTVLHDILMFLE
ncbi:MAG TPA: tRNA dimethylallyltransferase, partial [Candidatus Levybacteria bacterium]|nr:tRNA dimethylallyltransferase [Candidatus Levybacteria bacterium]